MVRGALEDVHGAVATAEEELGLVQRMWLKAGDSCDTRVSEADCGEKGKPVICRG